jgi:hypothetical protein
MGAAVNVECPAIGNPGSPGSTVTSTLERRMRMLALIAGGTRAGWRTVKAAAKDWRCPDCRARLRYFWLKCPNCGTRRPE